MLFNNYIDGISAILYGSNREIIKRNGSIKIIKCDAYEVHSCTHIITAVYKCENNFYDDIVSEQRFWTACNYNN